MVRLRQSMARQLGVRYNNFQSHYGAIATRAVLSRVFGTLRLSIPLWCDCDYEVPLTATRACNPFNPTMVRLRLA
mgnify:CR=1 FL=1